MPGLFDFLDSDQNASPIAQAIQQGDSADTYGPQFLDAYGAHLAQAIPDTAKNAFNASDAFRTTGQYDPAPVLSAALMGLGGGALAPEEGAAGVFGGKLSQTAPTTALHEAQRQMAAGVHPDEIWYNTGWHQGPGGDWSYEIPDTGASLKPGVTDAVGSPFGGQWSGTLGQAIDHPALFQAYPELSTIPTTIKHQAVHNGEFGGDYINANGPSANDIMGTVLHEVQHGIQAREDFPQGTAPQYQKDMSFKQRSKAFEDYFKHAGEVQSRNVTYRFQNPGDATTPPDWTMDRPMSQQTVSYSNNPWLMDKMKSYWSRTFGQQ